MRSKEFKYASSQMGQEIKEGKNKDPTLKILRKTQSKMVLGVSLRPRSLRGPSLRSFRNLKVSTKGHSLASTDHSPFCIPHLGQCFLGSEGDEKELMLFYLSPDPIRTPAPPTPSIFHHSLCLVEVLEGFYQLKMSAWNGSQQIVWEIHLSFWEIHASLPL